MLKNERNNKKRKSFFAKEKENDRENFSKKLLASKAKALYHLQSHFEEISKVENILKGLGF